MPINPHNAFRGPSAAEVAKHRLRTMSHRLGTRDPVPILGTLIDRTFELPLGDPRYGQNALLPGCLPLEHSFSETARDSLRLDMEPLGPLASPHTRLNEVSRATRSMVASQFGDPALRWFDERSEPFRGSRLHGGAKFGAWFGAQIDRDGLAETKVYYELGNGGLDELPQTLRHVARVAMMCLPRLTPIFTSISCNRSQGNQRVYFYHAGDLRLLDLEPLMNQLGIGQQLPSMLTAVGLILGGRFVLPEGSVVIALRDTGKGIEMKLEILLPSLPDPPREMHGLIQLHLSQRPEAQRGLQQWLNAMAPEGGKSAGDMTVLSVRVTPSTGARLTLYFRPSGYDQTSSRTREPRDLRDLHPQMPVMPVDPYAYS
jgi:hypothetical protein